MTKGDKTTKTKSSELDTKDLDKVAGGGRKDTLPNFDEGIDLADFSERHHGANPAPTTDLPGEAPGAVEPHEFTKVEPHDDDLSKYHDTEGDFDIDTHSADPIGPEKPGAVEKG